MRLSRDFMCRPMLSRMLDCCARHDTCSEIFIQSRRPREAFSCDFTCRPAQSACSIAHLTAQTTHERGRSIHSYDFVQQDTKSTGFGMPTGIQSSVARSLRPYYLALPQKHLAPSVQRPLAVILFVLGGTASRRDFSAKVLARRRCLSRT